MRLASVAAHFGRDIDRSLEKMAGIVGDARASGVDLLVFPDATLGGYLSDLRHPDAHALPPALAEDSFEVGRVIAMAQDMVVCFGYTEEVVVGGKLVHHNAALCVTGDGILGRHRKVHQPLGENLVLLVNLGWSAWLFLGFLRGRMPFAHLERWQTRYVIVYAAWAWTVVLAFPPLFDFA